jgi:hypothetical protein
MVTRRSLIKGFLGYLFAVPVILFFNWIKRSFAFPILRNESKNYLTLGNGKVVVIQNDKATSWDYKAERYLDYIDQNVVNTMVDEGICKLTCSQDPEGAWQRIMGSYKKGDKVAIKPNFNNINHNYHECFTSPQVIHGVVKGLVEYIEVPAEDIYVYDLCKEIPKELVRDRINYKVNYVERLNFNKFKDKLKLRLGLSLSCADKSEIIKMRNKVTDSNNMEITCYMPRVLTKADHLINISFLTNHIYILASGPLKNHFGTVRFSTFAQYPGCLHGDNIEEHIVDINLNPHIRNKTRLYICDGLFGVYARGDRPGIHKWKTFPCKNGTPNSLFFSLEPLAMEEKIADIITKERTFHGYKPFSDKYLLDYRSQQGPL